MFSVIALALLGLAAVSNASPIALEAQESHELSRRANTTTPFSFYNIPADTTDFVTDVTIGIDYLAKATLTNTGSSVSIPVTGSANINGSVYTLKSFDLTDPAIFLLNGEFYPAAARIVFTDGSTMSFLFILTPTIPNTPIINTILAAVGEVPAAGDTTTISGLDFTFFITTYITPDVFYKVTVGSTKYFVRQLPLSMDLTAWRGLKKAVTISGAAVGTF